MTSTPLLEKIDAYCDAIPRPGARAEEIGGLVLFVPEHGSWPYYARPRRGARVGTEDVLTVRAGQRSLQLAEAFEWIDDLDPSMRQATARDAKARGSSTIFLSAGSDQIANLYRSLGLRRIGTARAAEPM